MKYVIMAAFLLLSTSAFASGKLILQQNHFFNSGSMYPTVGLSVYQKVIGKLYYSGWAGTGENPIEDSRVVRWLTAKSGFDYYLGNVVFGGGFALRFRNADLGQPDHAAYAKISVQLW